ncbi:MAG: hypothetical protein Q9205_006170, partial [Flavoplaca limonia]
MPSLGKCSYLNPRRRTPFNSFQLWYCHSIIPTDSATKILFRYSRPSRFPHNNPPFLSDGDAQDATYHIASDCPTFPRHGGTINLNPTSQGQQTAMTTNLFVELYILLIYVITFTTALSPRQQAATSQNTSTPQSWNVVKFGRYNILGCSHDDSHTLQQLLGSLRAYIQPAIDDADQAVVRPSPAFTTFFHSALIAADKVSKILNDISTGRSAYPPSAEREESFHTTNVLVHGHPTLVCITEPGWKFGHDGEEPDLDGYDLCRDNPALVMDHFKGTQYINVCPQFFTIGLPPVPPEGQCLRVNKILNRFQGSGASISHYQIWVLLQEIAGYYMG